MFYHRSIGIAGGNSPVRLFKNTIFKLYIQPACINEMHFSHLPGVFSPKLSRLPAQQDAKLLQYFINCPRW